MTGHGRRCVRVAATSCSGFTSHRSVTTTVKSTACAQSAPWAYQLAAADAAVVGVASTAVVQHGRTRLAEGGVKGPLHGLRIDRPSLRARFLEVEFRAPHLGRDLGALSGKELPLAGEIGRMTIVKHTLAGPILSSSRPM